MVDSENAIKQGFETIKTRANKLTQQKSLKMPKIQGHKKRPRSPHSGDESDSKETSPKRQFTHRKKVDSKSVLPTKRYESLPDGLKYHLEINKFGETFRLVVTSSQLQAYGLEKTCTLYADPTVQIIGDLKIYDVIKGEDKKAKSRRRQEIRTFFQKATLRLRLLADNTPVSSVMQSQHGWIYVNCKRWAQDQKKTFYIPPLGDKEKMIALENWQVMDHDRQADEWEADTAADMADGKIPEYPLVFPIRY